MTQTMLPESILRQLPDSDTYQLRGFGISSLMNLDRWNPSSIFNFELHYYDQDNQYLLAEIYSDVDNGNRQFILRLAEEETSLTLSPEEAHILFDLILKNFSYSNPSTPSRRSAPVQQV